MALHHVEVQRESCFSCTRVQSGKLHCLFQSFQDKPQNETIYLLGPGLRREPLWEMEHDINLGFLEKPRGGRDQSVSPFLVFSFTVPLPHITLRVFYPNGYRNPISNSSGFFSHESSEGLSFRKSQSISLLLLILFHKQWLPHAIGQKAI